MKGGKETKKVTRKRLRFIILIILCSAAVIIWAVYRKENARKLPETAASGTPAGTADEIPEYSGEDVIELNGGMPGFTAEDLEKITGETYSELDALGRCGPATAMLDRSMMPEKERGPIGNIRPTGWVQGKYPGIIDSEPPYLYNRCHLIAYAMTGQNANERNLITGTRYLNTKTMLPYEEKVLRYLNESGNHVLYRATPCFKGSELVARGVELEAYSVEDSGEGVCFHVFLYNIQPGIRIDYQTGENWAEE